MVYIFQDLGYQVTVGELDLFGQPDEHGVAWGVRGDVDGWDDSADTTLSANDRIWGNGSFSNTAFEKGKSYTVTGQFTYPSIEAYHAACAKLKQAVSTDEHVLVVNDHGVALQATVKRESAITFKRKASNWCIFSFQEHADSPYRFNAIKTVSGKTGLPYTSGGLTFPVQFETDTETSHWLFNEKVVSGIINLTNSGSAASDTIVRVNGPVTNPRIEHQPSGNIMSANIKLGSGHYVIFDMSTRQILIDGTDPQQSIINDRQWAAAQPGENQWLFSAEDNEEAGTLEVSFREAYL